MRTPALVALLAVALVVGLLIGASLSKTRVSWHTLTLPARTVTVTHTLYKASPRKNGKTVESNEPAEPDENGEEEESSSGG